MRLQLQSVFDDDVPSAVKFGMLTSASTIRALSTAPQLTQRPTSTLAVLDPVMISTSGHTLLPDDAIQALKGLFKVVDWLTPNIPEAQRLSSDSDKSTNPTDIRGIKDLVRLAEKTAETCDVPIILLKGGHHPLPRDQIKEIAKDYTAIYQDGDDEEDTIECLNLWRRQVLGQRGFEGGKVVVDILIQRGSGTGAKPTLFVGKHVESDSTHGTGCTLSSAIAAAYANSPSSVPGKLLQSAILVRRGYRLIRQMRRGMWASQKPLSSTRARRSLQRTRWVKDTVH